MQITKRSPISRQYNTLDLPITEAQIAAWRSGVPIQNAMPHLSPDEREFLMTGITPAEWNEVFGSEE